MLWLAVAFVADRWEGDIRQVCKIEAAGLGLDGCGNMWAGAMLASSSHRRANKPCMALGLKHEFAVNQLLQMPPKDCVAPKCAQAASRALAKRFGSERTALQGLAEPAMVSAGPP